MKKRDFISISVISIILIISLIIYFATNKKSNIAHVYLENEQILEISLDKNGIYEVEGKISKLQIEVKDGKIGIIENECYDKTCIKMGFINDSSRTIICVPNGIIIKVDNNSNGVDISI